MKQVKTYKQVDSSKKTVHFGVSKMEDVYVKRNGTVDDPHRHNFYTVLIIKKAKGIHKIDFNSYELSNQQIFFIAPGQVHQVIEHEESIGFTMTFSDQFLVKNSIPQTFITSLRLFQNYGQTPPLIPNEEQFESILNLSKSIFTLFNSESKMKNLSIGAYLKLLLIECNNICSVNPLDNNFNSSNHNILKEFKESVDHNFRKEHSTKYYADLLFITPDHLNRIIKNKIGKTAKEYIQSRIIIESKRLLYFTQLSNKEISYKLGFNEPANFSAFFKKCTNLSPSNFKKQELKS